MWDEQTYFDCLKRERDICVKTILLIQNTAFRLTPALRWNGTLKGPKSEKRSIVRDCTWKEKINFEGFPQNGCYGNQPQPFEVVFYNIDANTSCSF